MVEQNKIIERIYIISVILAFGLLFYANAEEHGAPDGTVYNLGIGKAFYYPCAVALLSSFFLKRKYDIFEKTLYLLIAVALVSTGIHPPIRPNIMTWTITRFVFAILCFKDLRFISPKIFIKYLTIISPIIVLLHYVLSNPFNYGLYRYGGFYGDANFLALALNFIIVICYLAFGLYKNIIIRFCSTVSILGSIPLILLGMSRGGLLGLTLVLLFIAFNAYKYNKKLFYITTIALLLLLNPIMRQFGDTMVLIEERYSEGDVDARINGIKSVLNVFTNLPELIPFGIGPGNTIPMAFYYKSYGYLISFDIHNTYFSILYEMGIFACLLFISLYIHTANILFKRRNFLLLSLIFSSAFSLFTLPGSTFMPGWILLFFISNRSLYDIQ